MNSFTPMSRALCLVLLLCGSHSSLVAQSIAPSTQTLLSASEVASYGIEVGSSEIPGVPMSQLARQIYADFIMEGESNSFQLSGDNVQINYYESQIRCDHIELSGADISGCYNGGSGGSSSCNHATSGVSKIVSSGIIPESRGIAPETTIKGGSCATSNSQGEAICSSSAALYGGGSSIWRKSSKICPDGVEIDSTIIWVKAHEEKLNGSYVSVMDNYLNENPYYGVVQAAGNASGNNKDPLLSTFPSSSELANGHYHLGCEEVFTDQHGTTRDNVYDALNANAASKNVIAVASAIVYADRYENPWDVQISGHSSRGPTDDGRIKPDISAPVYDGTLESYTSATCGATDRYTAGFHGTSAAAPIVSGVYALLYEYQASNFADPFFASTYKALLNHTAFEVGQAEGPDYESGWGMINAFGAVDLLSQSQLGFGTEVIETAIDPNSATFQTSITAESSNPAPIKVSLAWNDPKGIDCRDTECDGPRLVNNLDLIVTDSQGNRYFPWTLDPSTPSLPAKQDQINAVDNYEQVEILYPIPGETYTILVVDASQNVQTITQTFSLIKSNRVFDAPQEDISLDVEFSHFEVALTDRTVLLNWSTSSETDNSHFVIQRALIGEDFIDIGRIEGSGTSRIQSDYLFQDDLTDIGPDTVSYRIKQVDFDGSIAFSVVVETALGHFSTPILHPNYPNPVFDKSEIPFSLNRGGDVSLDLYDVSGRLVRNITSGSRRAGRHKHNFDATDLPTGTYFLVLSTDGQFARRTISIR